MRASGVRPAENVGMAADDELSRSVPKRTSVSSAGTTTESPWIIVALRTRRRVQRWSLILLGVLAVFITLTLLPGRTSIPPLVESDYCYQLLAVDRMCAGHGFTSLQPVAPLQPWEWQYDWGFLTQWPIGYPLLIWALRRITGLSTLGACGWVSVAACALALVGWFVWIKRIAPRGITGVPLAAVAAGCAGSVGLLINPTTDAILVAGLPFILLLTTEGASALTLSSGVSPRRRALPSFIWAGLLAGGLFWIRYAAIFIPFAIGVFLLIEWIIRRRVGLRHVLAFGFTAAGPIVMLLAINRLFGAGPAQTQLNLGQSVGFDLSVGMIATAWWNFTDFGFYDCHRFSHWVFALWPIVLIAGGLYLKPTRKELRSLLAQPGVCLSGCVVAALFVVLIGATTLFGDKFDYVGLGRYYQPIKPLYFVLFVMPLLLIPRRLVKIGVGVVLLVGCSWLVRQEWPRPYQRWLAAERERTTYGQWAQCFTPNADALYNWLKEQASPELVVISNFHEYIALETQLPTLPIPPDVPTLDRWLSRIAQARNITSPRVLFVLDPDNKWRDYWIPEPAKVIRVFDLEGRIITHARGSAQVYQYQGPVTP
ncbi:MAG: hypothetical protein KJ749_14700 [Planctomycetes bacterium]|nr:hypothetical protein [Planctomycetota bacterium]